jgi:RNA polymerase sigma-70 factor (ECF subfamily)
MQSHVAGLPESNSGRQSTPARGLVGGVAEPNGSGLDFDQIVRQHGRALLSRASRLTRRQFDACDLVQDTVERALSRPPPDGPVANIRSWLFVIMQNIYLDRCRAAGRRRFVALSDDMMIQDSNELETIPAWRSVDLAEVHACLDRLDPRLREAYLLQVEQGLSLGAIAERLGTPVATVGTRLFRARRRLRALLVNSSTTLHPRTAPSREPHGAVSRTVP